MAGARRGRQRALRPLPGPGCSGSLLCRRRMTGTFTEPGRGRPVPRSRDPGRQRKSTDAPPHPASLGQPLPVAALYNPSWSRCGPFPPQSTLWSESPTCRDGVREQPCPRLRRWGVPAANGKEEIEVGDYLTLLFALLVLPSSILQLQALPSLSGGRGHCTSLMQGPYTLPPPLQDLFSAGH